MARVYKWERIQFSDIALNYFINPFGEIINTRGKLLKQRKNNSGYNVINLYIKKKYKRTFLVHRLVALTFIPNPNNLQTVNHIDGNKDHNYVSNLEWCSYSDNNKHAYDTGLHKSLKGESSPFAKYTEETVRMICKMLEYEPSVKKIAEKINISVSLVRSIKSKESWTSVSDQYKMLPTRFFMTKEIEEKIMRWYNGGKTFQQISSLLHWDFDSSIRKRIKRVLDKYNVQRLSK